MNEVLTVLGPTHNPDLPGVNEWCINSAAIDPLNKCAVVNSEDGHVYRWSFVTNTLSTGLKLAEPTGEAYTSTVIGPDGAIYAINNAQLACCDATCRLRAPWLFRLPIRFRGSSVIALFRVWAGLASWPRFRPCGDESLEAFANCGLQFLVAVGSQPVEAKGFRRLVDGILIHAHVCARVG